MSTPAPPPPHDSTSHSRRQLENLRTALDEHAIVSSADVRGNIIYANDRFCTVSGYSREELLGQNHRIVKSETHQPELFREMWRSLSNGKVWHGELCNRRKDGGHYWVNTTIVPLMDHRGKPYEYLSIRTDITELKAREEALRISEERMRRAQDFANVGTWDWNIATGSLFWSEGIAPLFGYPPSALETTFENFLAAVHPDDRAGLLDAIDACIAHGVPYLVEHRVVWPDGSVHWLAERGAVRRDAEGKALEMLGVVLDISDRIEAEQRARESATALEQLVHVTRDRVREAACIHAVSEALIDDAADDDTALANTVRAIPRGWIEPADTAARIVYRGRRVATADFVDTPWELSARIPGGEDADAVTVGILSPPPAGADAFRAEDVALLEQLARQIGQGMGRRDDRRAMAAARDLAEQASRAKSEFLSRMSHELRTPMNAIIGFAQMLDQDAGLNEDQQDNAHEILHAGRHLLELINEILDLSRIEAGHIDLAMAMVPLAPLLADCRRLIEPLAAHDGICLRVDDVSRFSVLADPLRLKQILLNLLSNAVKYNRPHGEIRLIVTALDDDWLRLAVDDCGPGIPADRLAEVFEPFHRLGAEAGVIEGTGIGLAIARRLVELMGGEIGVDSVPGDGATFWITLARRTPPAIATTTI